MSSNLAALKEKIGRMKKKQGKEKVVKVKKRVKKSIPRAKNLKAKEEEEDIFRDIFTQIKRKKYDEDDKYVEKAMKNPDWDVFSDEEKSKELLNVLKKDKHKHFGRVFFIEKFLNLPYNLQKNFVKAYLKQERSHVDFFNDWSLENAAVITKQVDEQELEDSELYTAIKKDLLKRAQKLAKEEDIEYDDLSYEEIVELLEDYDSEDIAWDYIDLARNLFYINPENLSMDELAKKIAKKQEFILNNSDSIFVQNLKKKKKSSLRKIAEENHIDFSKDTSKLELFYTILSKLSTKKDVKHVKKIVPIPESWKDIYVGKVKQDMREGLSRFYSGKELDEIVEKRFNEKTLDADVQGTLKKKKEKQKIRDERLKKLKEQKAEERKKRRQERKDDDETDEETDEEIELSSEEELEFAEEYIDLERKNLIEKLMRTTGKPVSYYLFMTLKELQNLDSLVNPTIEQVVKNPGYSWDWKELSKKKFPIESIIELSSKPWDWKELSKTTDIQSIVKYPNLPWDWKVVSERADRELTKKYPDLPWESGVKKQKKKTLLDNLVFFTNNPRSFYEGMSVKELKKEYEKIQEDDSFWIAKSRDPILTIEEVLVNIDREWDWDYMSQNMHINSILKHRDLPWNWDLVAKNYSVTPKIIKENPDIDWDLEFYEERNQEKSEKKEKGYMIDKLVRVTGKPEQYYEVMNLNDLEREYSNLEHGDVYWQELQRDTIIDELVYLTGKGSEMFAEFSTSELEAQLDMLKGEQKKEGVFASQKCINKFKKYDWIDAEIDGVWISPLEKKDISTYTEPETRETVFRLEEGEYSPKERSEIERYKDRVWYTPNSKWFSLICNRNSSQNMQNEDVFIAFDNNMEPHEFIVGYLSLRGYKEGYKGKSITIKNKRSYYANMKLLIQDTEMFAKERKSKVKKQNELNVKLQAILRERVSEESKAIAKEELSRALLYNNATNEDYGFEGVEKVDLDDMVMKHLVLKGENIRQNIVNSNTAYLNAAVNSVDAETNGELFRKVARVIVYLYLKYAKIFRERIKEEYYLPEILLQLTDMEMLPEVFDNPLYTQEDALFPNRLASFIETRVHDLSVDMAYKFYVKTQEPSARRSLRQKQTYVQHIEPSIEFDKNVCVNSEQFDAIPADNRVFYHDEEDNKIYCLDIEKIIEGMLEGNNTNPYTGKKYDSKFLKRYTVVYTDPVELEIKRNIDPDNKAKFIFPFRKLYKKFKKGDYINPDTGNPFSKKFIKSILQKDREKFKGQFQKFDLRLSRCVNAADVADEPSSNVVFYKDQENDKTYCFAIDKLDQDIRQNNTLNPYTERPFSKKFIEQFKKRYNTLLRETGYMPRETPVITEEEEVIVKKVEEPLIIPDLWKLMTEDVNERMKEIQGDEEEEEVSSSSESEEESSGSDLSSSDEKSSSKSEEEASPKEEKSDSKEEKALKTKKGGILSLKPLASFGFKTTCDKCKNSVGTTQLRTIRYSKGKPELVHFCSFECFEDTKFKYKGKKNKKHAKRNKN